MARLMGLDLGEKRVGVALSDESETLATPYEVVQRVSFARLLVRLEQIVAREHVRALVIGHPLVICGGVAFTTFSLLQNRSPAASATSTSSSNQPAARGNSIDQFLLNIYLSCRQGEVDARSTGGGDAQFSVQGGDTPASIGQRLKTMGLIEDAELFRLLARARGVENNLQAGEYTLQRGMTMDEILIVLQHGRDKPNVLTIVEGRRVEEIAGLLDKQSVVKANDLINAAKMSSAFTLPELNGR